ncbi:MAG: antiterminator LoaP, partial [Erysipelotrichaceae bacterium]
MKWYVLFVEGGKELALVNYLIENDKLKAFCPMVENCIKKNGECHFITKPMFPSYIFVESEMEQSEFQELIVEIRGRKKGIVKELKYDNEGTEALQKEEKEYIESLMNKDKIIERSSGVIENDQVIITDGPLIGQESRIVKIDRHKRIAFLEFNILGREIKIKVPLEI